MKKYVLIYELDDYPDNGGGIHFQFFDNLSLVETRVNELKKENNNIILFCGHIKEEIKFKPVEVATQWEIDKS